MRKGNVVRFNIKDIDPKELSEDPINVEKVKQLEGQFAVIASVAMKPISGDKDFGYYNIEFGDGHVLIAISGYHLTPYKK